MIRANKIKGYSISKEQVHFSQINIFKNKTIKKITEGKTSAIR
jgi:hypothetical protein